MKLEDNVTLTAYVTMSKDTPTKPVSYESFTPMVTIYLDNPNIETRTIFKMNVEYAEKFLKEYTEALEKAKRILENEND